MNKALYMKTTKDRFELPLAVADSPGELGAMTGKSANYVSSVISKKYPGWHKVIIEEDNRQNGTKIYNNR